MIIHQNLMKNGPFRIGRQPIKTRVVLVFFFWELLLLNRILFQNPERVKTKQIIFSSPPRTRMPSRNTAKLIADNIMDSIKKKSKYYYITQVLWEI